MRIIKKKGKHVHAYQLGHDSDVISELIKQGKISSDANGRYLIFSQESKNGEGEIAYPGDYIKVDSSGFPYPNSKEFFEQNHRHLSGDDYEQVPTPLEAWDISEGENEVISFLIASDKLSINPQSEDKYFNAFLWGANLSAGKDAVIVFYSVSRSEDNHITDIDFNFVSRTEFEKTYLILSSQ